MQMTLTKMLEQYMTTLVEVGEEDYNNEGFENENISNNNNNNNNNHNQNNLGDDEAKQQLN